MWINILTGQKLGFESKSIDFTDVDYKANE